MFAKLQDGIQYMLDLAGMDGANFRILFCALLSFPFSWVFKRLPDHHYSLKNFYIIAVASFYVFGILNLTTGVLTILISALGCYFITRYLRTSLMPWVNFLFLMGHLAYSHFKMQFFNEYNSGVIDITGAQMVLVMKLSAFGWNVYDGKQKAAPSEYTQARAIKKHPNILPFLGYVFFYPSLLTGPAFDFVEYDKFIHGLLFSDVPEDKRPGKRKRTIPRSGMQALSKTLQGFFWAACFLQAPKFVTMDYVFSDKFVTDHGFIYRIFYLWILGFSYRLKYYTIWQIAEGACILCGIGYNGYDEESGRFKWNRVQNIDPWKFETGQNVHECLEVWNMNTNKWLKHYVYTRIGRKGKKPGFKSTLFTFCTSAFWHGTRPGYYLTFAMGAFIQTVGKIYRRNFRPMFVEADGKTPRRTKPLYDLVCFIVTQLAFGFVCQPFVILDLRQSIYCWSTVYFYVPVGIFATMAIFKGPYRKQAAAWCKSFVPRPVPVKTLSEDETKKVAAAVARALEDDAPTLGVPPIDVLEDATREDLEEELRELTEAWQLFRARRGSSDLDGLKDAYNNFTEEINEIFQARKAELERKVE